AKRAGKLPASYRIPDAARANDPRNLARRFASWRARGLFAELPFGSDLSAEEVVLAKALRSMQYSWLRWPGRLRSVARALTASAKPALQPYLRRMALHEPASPRERLQQRILIQALERVLADST